jgi:hypothetical protein
VNATQKLKVGADWGWGRLRARRLRAAGFRLACRYLSHDLSKNINRAEAAELLKAGEDIVVVWESTAGRATQGLTPGRDDALAAVKQMRALKAPKGMAVYFAVDGDFAPAAVRQYARGFRKVCHAAGFRVGGYGSLRVINDLIHEGLVDVAWQTVAWSFGKLSRHADLYQRAGTRKIDGVSVDVDVICHPDYGGWQGALAKTTAARKAHEKKKRQAAATPAKKKRRGVPRISVTRAWLLDTADRAVSTFAQYFAATFGLQGLVALAGGHYQNALSLAHTAYSAAAAAALAVVKAAFAAKRKGTISPASPVKRPPA